MERVRTLLAFLAGALALAGVAAAVVTPSVVAFIVVPLLGVGGVVAFVLAGLGTRRAWSNQHRVATITLAVVWAAAVTVLLPISFATPACVCPDITSVPFVSAGTLVKVALMLAPAMLLVAGAFPQRRPREQPEG